MTAPEPLFDGYDPPPVPDETGMSADQRRTRRQADAVAAGCHPLALVFPDRVWMHPDADRTADRSDPPNLPLRCGSCIWRQSIQRANAYPKCFAQDGARFSHSAATDVRAWWPACTEYSAGDTTRRRPLDTTEGPPMIRTLATAITAAARIATTRTRRRVRQHRRTPR